MTTLETLILSKMVKDKEAKKASADVDPGRYVFDFLVRLQGEIRKGEPYEQDMTHRVRYSLLLAIALSKVNNETREAIMALYREAVESGSFDDAEKQVKKEAKEAVKSLATKGLCNGKVTTPKLNCEVVGEASIKKAANE